MSQEQIGNTTKAKLYPKVRNSRVVLGGISVFLGLIVNAVGPVITFELGRYFGFAQELVYESLFPYFGLIFIVAGFAIVISDWLQFRLQNWQGGALESSLENELKEAIERAREQPSKTKPAWDLARVRLELYFDRNISQINYIFWLCVIVMLVGFALITYGLSLAFSHSQIQADLLAAGSPVSEPVPLVMTPALIGVVAGIITEFIGATFLFIYRSTINQAASYIDTLERINSVGMAMQILDTISDDSKKLQDETKASIVKALLLHSDNLSIENE